MRTVFGDAYIEHKLDEKARETGNLAIEFETSKLPNGFGEKKPSGISVCTAGRWAQEFYPDCWILVPTARMHELAAGAYQVWGGDHNRFHIALVKWAALLKPAPAVEDDGTMTL